MSSIKVQIMDCPISIDEICLSADRGTFGAEVSFLGVVRRWNHGKKVIAVSYDAFQPLTENIIEEICREAQGKWGKDLGITVIHRIGRLEVGEISVFIHVKSVHRDEAYQTSRYVIEELKHRAPIWKKEHYEDGETAWLKGHALCKENHAVDKA